MLLPAVTRCLKRAPDAALAPLPRLVSALPAELSMDGALPALAESLQPLLLGTGQSRIDTALATIGALCGRASADAAVAAAKSLAAIKPTSLTGSSQRAAVVRPPRRPIRRPLALGRPLGVGSNRKPPPPWPLGEGTHTPRKPAPGRCPTRRIRDAATCHKSKPPSTRRDRDPKPSQTRRDPKPRNTPRVQTFSRRAAIPNLSDAPRVGPRVPPRASATHRPARAPPTLPTPPSRGRTGGLPAAAGGATAARAVEGSERHARCMRRAAGGPRH
eukprot:101579-Prymnesium_polylepis.1